MSYIRSAWPLTYFKTTSQEYVFLSDAFGGSCYMEDYNSEYDHKPSLIEMIGNFLLRETGDKKWVWKMVKLLAKDYGIEHMLRKRPDTFEETSRKMDKICERGRKEKP